MRKHWLLLALAAAPLGCGGDGSEAAAPSPDATTTDSTTGDPGAVTYYEHVKPILDFRCTTCHVEGGVGPFPLDTYAAARPMATLLASAVTEGRMPPWKADPACRHYADERLLTDEEKAAVSAWAAAGAPEGDPAKEPEATPKPGLELESPDIVAHMPEAYTPDASSADDYRCFILDATIDEETYVTAAQVVPGVDAIVHHVLVYAIKESDLATIQALDDEDAIPGYSCFGSGVGAGVPNPLAAYVPGTVPLRMDEDVAQVIPPGSRLVMQVHYNTAGKAPAPDSTAVQLETTDTPPKYVATSRPLPDLLLELAAGDASAKAGRKFVNYRDSDIIVTSAHAHMHLLGQSMKMETVSASGERTCLLSIPKWDFHWQQMYRFRTGETVTVKPGEAIELECVYDNSVANQPFEDGVQQQPKVVHWGEKTSDEMCLSYVITLDPYVAKADPTAACGAQQGCLAACDQPGSYGCLLSCGFEEDACGSCVLDTTVSCVKATCGLKLLPAKPCFAGCVVLGGDVGRCMAEECPGAWAELDSCVTPLLESGSCDGALLEKCHLDRKAGAEPASR